MAIKKITLKELGNEMPMGILGADKKYHKNISFRPWRMKEEKELGRIRSDNQGANIGRYVSMVVATMCDKLGPHDFSNMKLEEKVIMISQMFMGDVFAVYCTLRKHNMGNILGMIITCPRCGNQFDFNGDLDTLEVTTAEHPNDMTWDYDLKHPIQIRNKEITGFHMGLPLWSVIESAADQGTGSAAAKDEAIRGAIRGVKGDDKIKLLTSDELDELSKFDMESLVRKIDDNVLGPVMMIEAGCEKCRAEIVKSIDWRHDSFFGDSSR